MILLQNDLIANPLIVPEKDGEQPVVLQAKAGLWNVSLRNTIEAVNSKIDTFMRQGIGGDIGEYIKFLERGDHYISSVYLGVNGNFIEPKNFKIPFTGISFGFRGSFSEPINFQQLVEKHYLREIDYNSLGVSREVIAQINANICRTGNVFKVTEEGEGKIFIYREQDGDETPKSDKSRESIILPEGLIPVKA